MKLHRLAFLCASLAVCALATSAVYAKPKSAKAAAPVATVEADALSALQRMSAYLGTLDAFEMKADTTLDRVFDNGQKLQFGGQLNYKVSRPNRFRIDVSTDRKVRHFYYDGKTVTMYAPVAGLYTTIDAPNTIRAVVDELYRRHDIEIPIMDLFRWSDPNAGRELALDSGIHVGYSKINGVDTQHYAYREGGVDWQIWIAEGDRPVPVKLVITSTWIPGQPQFVSNMTWSEKSRFSSDTFTFKPPAGTYPIKIISR